MGPQPGHVWELVGKVGSQVPPWSNESESAFYQDLKVICILAKLWEASIHIYIMCNLWIMTLWKVIDNNPKLEIWRLDFRSIPNCVKMLLLSIWGFYQVTFVRMQNLEMIEGFLSLVFYVIQNFKRELFSSMRDFVRNHIHFFLGKKNSSTRVCIMIWWNYFHILFGFSKN